MKKQIDKFEYIWDIKKNIGYIKYYLNGGTKTKWIKHSNKSEFQIIITSLTNIKPIYLIKDEDNTFLSTGIENVGQTGSLDEI